MAGGGHPYFLLSSPKEGIPKGCLQSPSTAAKKRPPRANAPLLTEIQPPVAFLLQHFPPHLSLQYLQHLHLPCKGPRDSSPTPGILGDETESHLPEPPQHPWADLFPGELQKFPELIKPLGACSPFL